MIINVLSIDFCQKPKVKKRIFVLSIELILDAVYISNLAFDAESFLFFNLCRQLDKTIEQTSCCYYHIVVVNIAYRRFALQEWFCLRERKLVLGSLVKSILLLPCLTFAMQTICYEHKLYAILVGIVGSLREFLYGFSLDILAIWCKRSLCLQRCRSQYLCLLFP